MRRRLSVARPLTGDPVALRNNLSDLVGLARRIPGVGAARLLAREADVEVIELELADGGSPVVLEVVRLGDDELRFAQVDRFEGRAVDGRLEVSASGPGGAREITVALHGPMRTLGGRRRRALRSALERALEQRAHPADSPTEPVVLRLGADAQGLLVTIDGRRFRLVPLEGP